MTTMPVVTDAQRVALEHIEAYLAGETIAKRLDDDGEVKFEGSDVGVAGQVMLNLLYAGWLAKSMPFSNRHKWYTRTEKALDQPGAGPDLMDDPYDVVPANLFDDIAGYPDVKQWVKKSILERRRVHHAFIGPPASGKTLFLEEIERLPGAAWVQGSAATRAGILRLVIETKPRFLIIDEIDSIGPKSDAYSALLPLCEHGRITETMFNRRVDITVDTVVFLSGNSAEKVPDAVLSRFNLWTFERYNREQFVEAAVMMLLTREGLRDEGQADYIAQSCWDQGARDVRVPRGVARLCETPAEVDAYLRSQHLTLGRGPS